MRTHRQPIDAAVAQGACDAPVTPCSGGGRTADTCQTFHGPQVILRIVRESLDEQQHVVRGDQRARIGRALVGPCGGEPRPFLHGEALARSITLAQQVDVDHHRIHGIGEDPEESGTN
jgi:hypothetical protein